MEEHPLEAAVPDQQREADGGMRAPEARPAPPPEASGALDGRQRRGSLGPIPAAAPLDETASAIALRAHLAHLLDVRNEPSAPATPTDLGEQLLGLHEDLERQPDGVPHLVIGLTALCSVVLAAALIWMFYSSPTLGTLAGVTIAVVAIPVLVFKLGAKAERERDHEHPSR